MTLFPAPVSGQPIPRGWFARLVRFMNSLILHGDGSYTQVKHTDDGTFVTLTPSAVDALQRASGRPGGGSGETIQNLSVCVSGNTASVALSGSTAHVDLVGGTNVNLSGGTSGRVEISADNYAYLAWSSVHEYDITPIWTQSGQNYTMTPELVPYSGLLIVNWGGELEAKPENDYYHREAIELRLDGKVVMNETEYLEIGGSTASYVRKRFNSTVPIPVSAGTTISCAAYSDQQNGPSLDFRLFYNS